MLQYDTANGLAIDFAWQRENGRWRRRQKGTSGRGQGGRVCEGPRVLDDTGGQSSQCKEHMAQSFSPMSEKGSIKYLYLCCPQLN